MDKEKPIKFMTVVGLLLGAELWLGVAIIVAIAMKLYHAYPVPTMIVSPALIALLIFGLVRKKKK